MLRLQMTWFVLFTINSLGSSIIVALAGKYWSTIDPQDKFTAIVGIIVNWTGTLMVWLAKMSDKVQSGQNPSLMTGEPK